MTRIQKWLLAIAVVILFLLGTCQPRYKETIQEPTPVSVEVTETTETPEPVLDARPKLYTAERIIDGDTFIAVDSKGDEVKVRMAGIDAPESKQVFGKESADYLTVLLHEPFSLRLWSKDRYDRQIATVLVGGEDANQVMVQNGYAWACDEYKQGPSYIEDQEIARAEGRGLWNEKSTLPPWYFRKINGHSGYGYQLLRGGFYLWDGVIHNYNCPGKVDASHSWNGVDAYENCPKCGGLVYD